MSSSHRYSGRYSASTLYSLIKSELAPSPVNLIKQAQGARTVTLGLDAFALVSDKYTQIGGEITLALDALRSP